MKNTNQHYTFPSDLKFHPDFNNYWGSEFGAGAAVVQAFEHDAAPIEEKLKKVAFMAWKEAKADSASRRPFKWFWR